MSTKHPGDPTPESPTNVLRDKRWLMVESAQELSFGGLLMNRLTVMHRGSETYWQCVYTVMTPAMPATWSQVTPVSETRTVYKKI